MHLNILECSKGCQLQEDQRHIFSGCDKLNSHKNSNIYAFILEDIYRQKEAISIFLHLEERRKEVNTIFKNPN